VDPVDPDQDSDPDPQHWLKDIDSHRLGRLPGYCIKKNVLKVHTFVEV
jgi:hypothetical protein